MSTTTKDKPSFTPPPPSDEHAATRKVADRLVSMIREGKSHDAITELYADNARHVEPMSMPGCDSVTAGKAALLEKSKHWEQMTTVHDAGCEDPIINGNQFICNMFIDATHSEGPMAGQRMKMSETALYTVKDGKITEAKFFYGCGM